MRMKHLLYIFIPFLFAFSCEQNEDKIISNTEDQIVGEWIWIKSTYYNTNSGLPFILTPDSVGYSIRELFGSDGTYILFKNDIVETSGIYWLETVNDIKYENAVPDIRLYSQKEEYINFSKIEISGDSLLLDNTAADGTLKLFRRLDNSR